MFEVIPGCSSSWKAPCWRQKWSCTRLEHLRAFVVLFCLQFGSSRSLGLSRRHYLTEPCSGWSWLLGFRA